MLKSRVGARWRFVWRRSGAGHPDGQPQVNINGITAGQTVDLNPDDTFQINFSVSNFTLESIGNCGTNTNCGQVYLNIDGNARHPRRGAASKNATSP